MILNRIFGTTASRVGFHKINTRINLKYVGRHVIPRRNIMVLPPGVKVQERKPGEAPLIPGKSGRYAMFFFEEAYELGGDKAVRNLEKELDLLAWSVRKDKENWEFVTKSPLLDLEARIALVKKHLSDLGLSPFFTQCILALVERNEISRLNQIRADYEEIMQIYRREVEVVFTTGFKPPQSDLDFYQKSIKLNFLQPSDNMIFTHSVDPTIVRGYTVTVAGVTYDFTWNKDIEMSEQEFKSEIRQLVTEKAAYRKKLPKFDSKALEADVAQFRDYFPPDFLPTTTSSSSIGH